MKELNKMADQLKACPFCGSEATINEAGTHATCTDCAAVPWIFVGNWNTRAEPVGVPTVQAGMEKPLDGWAITMQEGGNIFVESPSGDSAHVFMDDISPLAEVTRQLLQTLAFGSCAAPSQPVAAQSKALTDDLVDWDRISEAAKQACNEYGQWMPERWLQLFVNAYNRNKS